MKESGNHDEIVGEYNVNFGRENNPPSNIEAMDFNLCRRILSDYHPLHMILLLKSTVNICELRELLAL